MRVTRDETLPVRTEFDIVTVRQQVRTWAVAQGLGLVDQTKLVTAASELARNTVEYGGGGTLRLEALDDDERRRRGVRLTFTDEGPGIADVERALSDGYTTGNGMGLGLGGARRLVNDFHLESGPGSGTRVTIARWK